MLDGVVEIINCVEVKTTVFPTHNQQVFNKVEVSDRGGELIWLILHKNMVMRVEDCWETDNSAFIGSEEVPQFWIFDEEAVTNCGSFVFAEIEELLNNWEI